MIKNFILLSYIFSLSITSFAGDMTEFSPHALAQDLACFATKMKPGLRTINFSGQFPEVGDQSDVGWCYAHAAADMISFKLHKVKELNPAEFVSANYLALNYNRSYRNSVFSSESISAIEQFTNASRTLDKREQELGFLLQGEAQKISPEYKKLYDLIDASRTTQDSMKFYLQSQELMKDLLLRFPNLAKIEALRIQTMNNKEGLIDPTVNFKEASGGSPDAVINSFGAMPYCTENEMPNPKMTGDVLNGTLSTVLASIYYSFINATPESNKINARELAPFFTSLSQKKIFDLISKWRPGVSDPISDLMDATCTKTLPETKRYRVNRIKKAPFIMGLVEDFLESGNPVLITYNPFRAFGLRTDTPAYNSANKSHASLVVGREYNCLTNQNMYIVRNSWGKRACVYSFDQYLSVYGLKNIQREFRDCANTCRKEDASCGQKCTQHIFDRYAVQNKLSYYCKDDEYYISGQELEASLYSITVND